MAQRRNGLCNGIQTLNNLYQGIFFGKDLKMNVRLLP